MEFIGKTSIINAMHTLCIHCIIAFVILDYGIIAIWKIYIIRNEIILKAEIGYIVI